MESKEVVEDSSKNLPELFEFDEIVEDLGLEPELDEFQELDESADYEESEILEEIQEEVDYSGESL